MDRVSPRSSRRMSPSPRSRRARSAMPGPSTSSPPRVSAGTRTPSPSTARRRTIVPRPSSSSRWSGTGRRRSRATGSTRLPTPSGSRPHGVGLARARRPRGEDRPRGGLSPHARPHVGATSCAARRVSSGGRTALALRSRRPRAGAARSAWPSCRAGAGRAGRAWLPRRRLRGPARGDDDGTPLGTGCAMVTAETVWRRSPTFPTLRSRDLAGRSRRRPRGRSGRQSGARRVHADIPGLPGAGGHARPDGPGRPRPSAPSRRSTWSSTTRGRPTASRRRAAANWRSPASRRRHSRSAAAPTLVQLDARAFRCPYCGSTDTKLENIFGPTPCRSIRYCESCRQPFEQFKTI